MSTHPSLELRCVSHRYAARTVLVDCDLVIPAATHTAILGTSGSGKTTALRLLAGLETPTSGNVLVDGARASEPGRILIQPHQRRIAMVFQDLGLWPALSVFENVLLGLTSSDYGRDQRQELARAALSLCRIEGLADRRPGALSGGEQQRAALARAIAVEPRFLLLDEPFAGLDLVTKRDLLSDIAELAATRHTTLVLITHDPIEALALCDRAVEIRAGRIQTDGPWADVLRDPQSDLLRAFRECLPSRDARHGREGKV